MAVIAPRVKKEEKVFILLCACWGVSPVVGVCAYAVCVYGRVFICVCVCARWICACACGSNRPRPSSPSSSVAGAPRSSFSRAMTRSEIVMKLLIYLASRRVTAGQGLEGRGSERWRSARTGREKASNTRCKVCFEGVS